MSAIKLKLDLTDWQKLKKFYKKAPKKAQFASASVLNSMAFQTRMQYIDNINNDLEVRSPGFVKSSIRVERAKGSEDMSRQLSMVGSIERANFSGWVEQETGETTEREKLITKKARGGSFAAKISSRAKLRKGRSFPNPNDFPGVSLHQKAVVLLQVMGRGSGNKPFIMFGHNSLIPGLYEFQGGTLTRLQSFVGDFQPKKNPLLIPARNKVFTLNNLRFEWAKAIEFQLRKIKF